MFRRRKSVKIRCRLLVTSGQEGGIAGEWHWVNECGASFGGDARVLKFYCDGCISLSIYLKTLNYILYMDELHGM